MFRTKKTKTSVESRPLDLCVESLESRRLLTGFVDVHVSGGSLVITGDALDNIVQIDQTGLASDEFRVTPVLGTEIVDEGAVPVVYSGVTRDIRVIMNDGNDGVFITDAKFRDLRFSGGDGNSAVVIDNFSELRNAFITNGNGNDVTVFEEATLANQLKITNGDGNSSTTIDHDVEIHGNVSIVNGLGFDTITLDDSDIHRNVTIRNSAGGSLVTTDHADIDGNLRITNGAGDDELSLRYGRIARSVTATNADGWTEFTMSGTRIWGNLTVRGTEGASNIDISNTTIGTIVQGNLMFSLGTGPTVFNAQNFYSSKNFTLRTDGATTLDMEWIIVSGRTQIVTGTGADVVRIDDGVYAGRFDLRTGAGDDELRIDNSGNVDWDTKFHGPVMVNLGEGDDLAILGHKMNQNNIDVAASSRFIGGEGSDLIDYRGHGNIFERTPTMLQFEFET